MININRIFFTKVTMHNPIFNRLGLTHSYDRRTGDSIARYARMLSHHRMLHTSRLNM